MSAAVVSLSVGDRVMFAEEKQGYTVRAVTRGGRFAICTKPFNPLRSVLYSVIDFERGVRGRDNYYGLGYETDDDIARALHEFQHTEDHEAAHVEPWRHLPDRCVDDEERGFFCHGGAEVSRRTANHITLRIERVR